MDGADGVNRTVGVDGADGVVGTDGVGDFEWLKGINSGHKISRDILRMVFKQPRNKHINVEIVSIFISMCE